MTPWQLASISADRNICAVGIDKRLRCWAGYESVQVPSGNFEEVSVGEGTSCAIRTSGAVVCWGEVPLEAPAGRYATVSAGYGEACGIRTSGRLHCWWARYDDEGERARDGAGTPQVPAGRYTAISLHGDRGGCARRDDGLLACWDLGDVETSPSMRYLALGGNCAVTMAGDIECFGSAYWDGDGMGPEPPPGPFVAVDGERYRGCALRATGALVCWGRSGYDMDGNEVAMPTPPDTYKAVSVGGDYACALQTDNRALCWSNDTEPVIPAPLVTVKAPNFVLADHIPVTWRATTVSAPITGYDVEYTTGPWTETEDDDPVATWTRLLTGTRKTKAALTGEQGKKYWWRVRAHDADGLVSNWSETYGTSMPLDDRALQPTGPWRTVHDDSYLRGTALRTTTKGATLLISQEGAYGLIILGTTCPGCGTFTLRFPSEDCWDDEEAAGSPRPSCRLALEDDVKTRGARRASAFLFMGNNGQEGYAGPLELVVTSEGKPVTIDAVVFADTE